jgi:hypothetical protein
MRVAVLSDIHGNRQALEALIADAVLRDPPFDVRDRRLGFRIADGVSGCIEM